MRLNLLLLVFITLSLSACKNEKIEGKAFVKNNLTIYGKRGAVNVPPGSYYMQLMAQGNSGMLKFFDFHGNEKARAEVSGLSKLASIENQQRVYLRGSEIGQAFDVDLSKSWKDIRGSERSTSQRCVLGTTTRYRQVCGDYYYGCPGYGYGYPGYCGNPYDNCYQQPYTETVYGSRGVRGYDVTKKQYTSVKLVRGLTVMAQMLQEKVVSNTFQTLRAGSCE
jgi:hypothetical protein